MNATARKEITSAWTHLRKHIPLHPIRSAREYSRAVAVMNDLIDTVGSDEKHPLAELLHAVGGFIKEYEDTHCDLPKASGVDCLRLLMNEHGLRQADLAEILGGQSVVSAVLAGDRELNLRQIRRLAEFFHVSAAVFV